MATDRTPPVIPPALIARRHDGPEWADWLDRLPTIAAGVRDEWHLTQVGPVWHGACSWVAPVVTVDGESAVLKLALPDEESEHEHFALQRWQGRGAVRLLRADPHRRAMLLERLDRTDLTDAWDEEACEIVGALLAQLHVPPVPQLRDQSSYVVPWLDALARDLRDLPMPRRMAEQAVSLGRDLVAESPTAVVHGDLHFANVLRGARDGVVQWLAIDPKPSNGDPHSECEPMLRNRFDEYGVVGSVRDGIRRRFHTLVDTAGLDEDRARDWVVVRSIVNAHWTARAAAGAARKLTAAERDHVTRCITLAKAVQE